MKNTFIIIGVALVLLVVASLWSRSSQSNDANIISTAGMHWHPQIEIFAKGEKQEIPANIGIGPQNASAPTFNPRMGMTSMHTHETDGVIHLEFEGRVTKEDTKLGNFFRIWNKDFAEFGSLVKVTVNDKENTDFENYEMKDGDKIRFEYN